MSITFRDAVRATSRNLKAAFARSDDSRGVGNIYADESCFRRNCIRVEKVRAFQMESATGSAKQSKGTDQRDRGPQRHDPRLRRRVRAWRAGSSSRAVRRTAAPASRALRAGARFERDRAGGACVALLPALLANAGTGVRGQ